MRKLPMFFFFNRVKILQIVIILALIVLTVLMVFSEKFEVTEVYLEALEYEAKYCYSNKEFFKVLQHNLDNNKYLIAAEVKIKPLYKLIVKRKLGERVYYLRDESHIYLDKRAIRLNSQVKNWIKEGIEELDELSPYGKLVSWEQANFILPKYSKMKVRDLDTGLSFRVQRRAGSNHADVQPLTKEDTAIFKKIYGGQWGWRRRAVVVEINGKKLAASMNGMPHGSGAISGNNFPGHFCLHFLGSKIHSNKKVDLAHQIMVWKGAGKFEEFLKGQNPANMPEIFFLVIDQKEMKLLDVLVPKEEVRQKAIVMQEKVSKVKVDSIKEIDKGNQVKVYQGKIRVVDTKQKEVISEYNLRLIFDSRQELWHIDSIDLS